MFASILICSTKYGGCGHIGQSEQFSNASGDGDVVLCPQCFEDHTFGLSWEKLHSLTNLDNFAEARKALLDREEGARAWVHAHSRERHLREIHAFLSGQEYVQPRLWLAAGYFYEGAGVEERSDFFTDEQWQRILKATERLKKVELGL